MRIQLRCDREQRHRQNRPTENQITSPHMASVYRRMLLDSRFFGASASPESTVARKLKPMSDPVRPVSPPHLLGLNIPSS
jgi:hypothetical protein